MRISLHIVFLIWLMPLFAAIPVDSASAVSQRFFDEKAIAEAAEEYADEDVSENSLMQRILRAIAEFLADTASSRSNTGEYIYIGFGILILLVAIYFIMKMQGVWIFAPDDKKDSNLDIEVLKDDIHSLNFDTMIAEAEAKGRYNLAVRLLFLRVLKVLSDRNVITWEPNKTNREYYYELKDERSRSDYERISDYFDRAWYGEYMISQEQYSKLKPEFVAFENGRR